MPERPDRNRPIEAQLADAEKAADDDATASPPAVTEPGNGVEVAAPPRPKPATVAAALSDEINMRQIREALPDKFPGGEARFVRIVHTAVRMNPELLRCEPMSVVGAAMQAAQLGLTPNMLGESWLIPRGGRCTFQIGWKGMLTLAARSKIRITGDVVYERDEFRYTKGLDPTLVHVPADGDRGKATHWYAVAREMGTRELIDFAVLTRADVEKRRKAGGSGSSPAWRDWPDEMGLKSAAKAVCRFLPLTVEDAEVLATDGTVRTTIGGSPTEYPAAYDDAIETEALDR